MKHKNSYRLLILALMGIFIYSCQKEEPSPIESAQVENEQINMSGMTQLGKKLENPYSVTNMKRAWESLNKSSKVSKNGNIETTHLYVKFSPKTEEELDMLKRDSTLVLYQIPLDYEVTGNGDFYHDPEVPLPNLRINMPQSLLTNNYPRRLNMKFWRSFLFQMKKGTIRKPQSNLLPNKRLNNWWTNL